jgi:hypothetical protein
MVEHESQAGYIVYTPHDLVASAIGFGIPPDWMAQKGQGAMTQISTTDSRCEGIRELTREEIAVVAGGDLSGIAGTIACTINRIISCFVHKLFCQNNV